MSNAFSDSTGSPVAARTKGGNVSVAGEAVVKPITLSLSTSKYAGGDVLADTQKVTDALRTPGGTGVIQSLAVVDKDAQGGALDVVFLKTNVSLGTENSAVSISDANAQEILGIVSISGTNYIDFSNSKVATKGGLGIVATASGQDTSLYVAAVSSDTKTYSAHGITLNIGILQD